MYDFFLFNKSGVCILEKQLEILFNDISQYNKYKLIIKNMAHSLLINIDKNKPKNQTQEMDKLNINKNNNNPLDNEFIFKNIQNDKIKILFLIKNNNILVGTFPKSSSIEFQRFLLVHIFIALINFKGDFISIVKKINECEKYDKDNFINLKILYNKKLNLTTKETNDILEILIFEYYFLKSIILHFSKVFSEIFKKEDLNLKTTKFRNLYILDINSLSVILDMSKIQGDKNNKKNKKFYKLKNLFDEIIYHSKHMYDEYIKENKMKYNSTGSDFRFVKFECTSTYPRLLFIIKFIPILKGITVIHIYSQKKLSRNNENNIQSEQGINCKEVDLLFGSFIKDNPNFEFKYGAPKKLDYIEKFLEEFFITGRNGFGIFCLTNLDKKYKYVNYSIIKIINNFMIPNISDIDKIFNDINKKIEENYEKEQKEKDIKNSEDSESSKYNKTDGSDMKRIDKLFSLSTENIYKEIISRNNIINNKSKKTNNNNNINSYNKSIISKDTINNSKTENNIKNKVINLTNSNNIDNNLKINDYINTNSERKNLINNDNRTISLYNSNDNYNYKNNKSISRNSKNDNFSLISEVKMNERFEIKVINIKEKEKDENKEETKEKISDNSSSNEKELKINELLDLINSSKKINSYIKENNKIQEDFQENELTRKDINSSKLSKKSISGKKTSKIVLANKEEKPESGTSRDSMINH